MQFRLIAGNGVGRPEPLTTELADGRRAPCVFGLREEAEPFLWICARRRGRARATGIGELVSVSFGPCAEVVAPDPLPPGEAAALNTYLCVDRNRSAGFLLRKGSGR